MTETDTNDYQMDYWAVIVYVTPAVGYKYKHIFLNGNF
jgi:hypothetical protein